MPQPWIGQFQAILLITAIYPLMSNAATWVGSTSADMNTAANWSAGLVPTVGGDTFAFNVAGTAGATLNNNITGQILTSSAMTFNSAASAYTLNGNAVTVGSTLNAKFDNYSAFTQTINVGLNLAQNLILNGGVGSTSSGFVLGGTIGQGGTAGPRTIRNDLGAGTLTISGTMNLTSSSTARIWTFGGTNSNSTLVTGVIQNGSSGVGAVTVYTTNSLGGVTLSGANTYTGATTVNSGTLKLDFSAATFLTDIINSSSPLTLAGGTLNITGKSGATNSQQFNGTTFDTSRASAFRITQNSAFSVSAALGGLTRSAGSTVDFTLPTNGTITTTSTTANVGANAVLASSSNVAYGTVDGTTWATNASGTIAALGTYQTAFTSNTGNTDITASLTPSAFITNTLRFNTTGAVLTLNSSGSSTVTSGGILVTPAGAGSSISSGGTGAGLTVGGGKELVIINNTTGASGFTISAPILDNATSALTVAGPGITTLTGTNTYTGTTSITGGVLDVGALTGLVSPSLGAGGILFGGGGVLQGNGSFTRDFSGSLTAANNQISGYEGGFAARGGTLTINFGGLVTPSTLSLSSSTTIARFGYNFVFGSANADSPVIVQNPIGLVGATNGLARTFTVNAAVGSTGSDYAELQGIVSSSTGDLTKAGTGILVLSAANTYGGTTRVNGGVLRLNNSTALPGGIGSTGGVSGLLLNGGIVQLTAASGDFTRPISTGSTAGSMEVGWADNAVGGFAAIGGDRTVNFGGSVTPASVIWSPTGGRFGGGLILSHSTSDSTITIANPIALNAAIRTITVNNGTPTVDGILSGALTGTGSGILKNGPGTLALTGNSTFGSALTAGTTFITVSAGTLQIGNGSASGSLTGSGAGDIQNDATLAFNRSDALTMQFIIKGGGAVNQIGTGTTTLSGTNTYTGGTIVTTGGLTFLNTNARPATGTVTVAVGATLGLGVASSGSFFTSANVNSLFANTLAGVTISSTSNVGIDTTAGNFTHSSNIASTTRGLTKLGLNSLSLSGTNSYSGGTNVTTGGLTFLNTNARPATGTVTVAAGATLGLGVATTGSFFTSANVDSLFAGTLSGVTNNAASNVGIDTTQGNFTYASSIPSSTNRGLVKLGINTLSLSGNNTSYNGATNVNAGSLSLLNTNAKPAGTVTVVAGATLGLGVGSGAGLFSFTDVENLLAGNYTGNVANVSLATTSSVGVDTTAGDLIYNASIPSTTRGLTKLGTNTLSLGGANLYTGATTAGGGLLKLDSAGALPGGVGATGGTSNLVFSGGVIGLTADFNRAIGSGVSQVRWITDSSGGFAAFGADRTVNFGGASAPVTWSNANGILGDGLILSYSTATHSITIANPISLSNGGGFRTVTVNDGLDPAVDAILAGVINSTTTANNGTRFIKNGTGTLAFTADNTYVSGNSLDGTTISAGTLQLGNGGTTGSILYLPTVTGIDSDVSISSSATFAFNRSDTGLIVANTILGAGSVSQRGSGTATLTGANTYSGGTSVTNGTLLINNTTGSGTGTGAVNTSNSTILGGTGTLSLGSGNGISVGGSLAPGDPTANSGVGTLIFTPVNGDANFTSTSTLDFQLLTAGLHGYNVTYNGDGTLNTLSGTYTNGGNDRLIFNGGALSNKIDFTNLASSNFNITFASGYVPAGLDLFDLLDWANLSGVNNTSAISGLNTSQLDLPSLSGGLAWDISKWASDGVVAIYTVVPEPSKTLLVIGGLIVALLRRCRARDVG